MVSDEKLLEHAKTDSASFLVFMDSAYVSKTKVSLRGLDYAAINNTLKTFYSSILERYGIPSVKLGLVFNNFNGFEVSLNNKELLRLQNAGNIQRIEINHKFKVDLPASKASKSLSDKANSLKVENASSQSTDIVPPRVALVWSINPANQASSSKTVWILGTGVDLDHQDLNVDISRAVSFVSSEPSANDLNGHGTHVAGIIGAKRNDFQVVGVAPNARIVPVKVLDQNGYRSDAQILSGLDYVQNNAASGDVVNISIEYPVDNPSTILDQKIISIANAYSIYFTICAGNWKANTANRPMARIVNGRVYVVGATENNNRNFAVNFSSSSQGSNWGNNIVAAPGVSILSSSINEGAPVVKTGTSMAAPHVAGLLMYKISCGCFCEPQTWLEAVQTILQKT